MNEDPNILVCYILNRNITIVSIYIDDFFLISNHLSIHNILKKVLKSTISKT